MTTATTSPIDLYDTFVSELATGDIRPGDRLGEESLAARWGVGRVPVREVLLRLEQDGLVSRRPGSGTYVRDADDDEVLEIFDVRIGLEPIIAAAAARTITDEQIPELMKLAREADRLEGSGYEREARDRQFHRYLSDISGLRHATRIVHLSRLHLRCATMHQFMSILGGYTVSGPNHMPIAEAIAECDARRAGTTMARHLRAAKKAVTRDLQRIRAHRKQARQLATM